ncbi:MAG TPA: FHA domain-containing protein [Sandaracinaceae bacterium LLY-WYZ-13_1]|nr:FHA domain-containing protein [Sandaracinaceae bacterium LLY-WYZ-13_1]
MPHGYLQITSDPSGEPIPLETERAVVGSGPEADIRLPAESGLAAAHFELEPREVGCRVRSLPGVSPAQVEGMPHEDGVLPWGAEIHVGASRLRLVREADDGQRARPSLVMILAPFILGFALWSILSESDRAAIPEAPSPPALFADERTSCDGGEAPARAIAVRDERAGRAMIERYPFDPAEGVQAVARLRHAAACFRAAGDRESESRVTERRTELEERVRQDYGEARYRLGRALARRDYQAALHQTRRLSALLSDRPGTYQEWLTTLERRLRLRQADR